MCPKRIRPGTIPVNDSSDAMIEQKKNVLKIVT